MSIDDISYYGVNFYETNANCTAIQHEVFLKDGLVFKIQDVKITNTGGIKVYEIFLEEY